MMRTRSARSTKPAAAGPRASLLSQTDVVKIDELQFGRDLGKVLETMFLLLVCLLDTFLTDNGQLVSFFFREQKD